MEKIEDEISYTNFISDIHFNGVKISLHNQEGSIHTIIIDENYINTQETSKRLLCDLFKINIDQLEKLWHGNVTHVSLQK